jgi:hypothetical protein
VAIQASRDANGLHGEFVRRDLRNGGTPSPGEVRRQPSWTQAIEDGRARRRREAERARTRIEARRSLGGLRQ